MFTRNDRIADFWKRAKIDWPEIMALKPWILELEPVGSRVICVPRPVGTDEDWLIHLGTVDYADVTLADGLRQAGWLYGGSLKMEASQKLEDRWHSLKKGYVNLLITPSRRHFESFMAATYIAQRLNVTNKDDRKALFEAVQYHKMVGAIEYEAPDEKQARLMAERMVPPEPEEIPF